MNAPEVKRVSTPNMAEVLYLLDRHHTVVDVGMQPTWPYGIEELCVTLEGVNIDFDHHNYMRFGSCKLTELKAAFDAVMAVVWRKDEEACYRQGAAGARA